jgi:hypothetical protein
VIVNLPHPGPTLDEVTAMPIKCDHRPVLDQKTIPPLQGGKDVISSNFQGQVFRRVLAIDVKKYIEYTNRSKRTSGAI